MKKIYSYQAKISIPKGVSVNKKDNLLSFSGPLGVSKINITKIDKKGSASFFLNQQESCLYIETNIYSLFNSFKSLFQEKIDGVSRGFLLSLRLVGIGYRATLKSNILYLKVGYSHDVQYIIPDSIRIFLVDPTTFCLFGIDKNQVTQIAAKIKQIKPPSPYKGKGIRLAQEEIVLKQGKQK